MDEDSRPSSPGPRTCLAIADLWSLNDAQRQRMRGVAPDGHGNRTRQAPGHGGLPVGRDIPLRKSLFLRIDELLRTLHATELLLLADYAHLSRRCRSVAGDRLS